MMEKHKKWCKLTIGATIVILVLIAGVCVVVDPFFHYHTPLKNLPYTLDNETYQNPGIARHFEYDSLITGSSMAQNFKTSTFKDVLGANAIKVCYSGGRSKDMNTIIEKALRSNPNLKTVYFGLDARMLKTEDVNETRNPLPEYLYNRNPLDDVSYLFNKDVLFSRIDLSVMGAMKGQKSTSFDEYSYWQKSQAFSQSAVMASLTDPNRAGVPDYSLDHALQIAEDNLRANFLPLIEAYPDTKFVIFSPPYSILYWYQNYAEYELSILEYSIKALLKYDNIELFLFHNIPNLITNLYNYKDYTHYRADINAYMVDCFKDGTHRISAENYRTELEKTRDLVLNFDFGLLFGESNPFIVESNCINYLDKLNDKRYITFIAMRADAPASAHDMFGEYCERFGLDHHESHCGYIAVLDGERARFQSGADHAMVFEDTVNNLDVRMVSEKRENEDYIEIIIDGVKYTTNMPGVNIVVYDTVHQRVMDNIALNIDDGKINRG